VAQQGAYRTRDETFAFVCRGQPVADLGRAALTVEVMQPQRADGFTTPAQVGVPPGTGHELIEPLDDLALDAALVEVARPAEPPPQVGPVGRDALVQVGCVMALAQPQRQLVVEPQRERVRRRRVVAVAFLLRVRDLFDHLPSRRWLGSGCRSCRRTAAQFTTP